MNGPAGKLAPTAAVAAVVAWCCWSYVGESGTGFPVNGGGNPPKITTELLAPQIAPASSHDPFRPEAETEQSSENDAAASSGEDQIKLEVVGEGGGPPVKAPDEVFASLTLDATCIQGDRRVALIDGRVYAEGELLAIPGSATEPWVVAEVSPHHVLLWHRGQIWKLEYRNTSPASSRAEPADGGEAASVQTENAAERPSRSPPAAPLQ